MGDKGDNDMSADLDLIKEKFIVMNLVDIDKYLNDGDIRMLASILQKIDNGREKDGKKENMYIVINTDEPYIDEIIKSMRRYNQWGEKWEKI